MFTIHGKYADAKCFAEIADEKAVGQIQAFCDLQSAEGSRVRIMPDMHAGKGCTIGTTVTIKDKVCPNMVGVDIGCGMYLVKLKERAIDFEKLDEACHILPSGMRVWASPQEFFDLSDLRCFSELRKLNWLACSLGSLGGGNHFIEAEKGSDGSLYLVIHSGSRNLGKQVAEIYQKKAVDRLYHRSEYLLQRDNTIQWCKENGCPQEIQPRLQALKDAYENQTPEVPETLSWIEGQDFDDYMHDIEICQRFARRNRERMAEFILDYAGLSAQSSFHTIHNYVDVKNKILRKGAVSAYDGETVLIPMNMRDGSILARGKGNPDWNYSAPHGAGRLMSRRQALSSLSLDEYRRQMEGIYTTSVNMETLDEAPMAYKPLEAILPALEETVEIIEILKPLYNFKAAEEPAAFGKHAGSTAD